jgi:hypothetical protein
MFLWQIGFLYLGGSRKGRANKMVLWQIGFFCILVGALMAKPTKWVTLVFAYALILWQIGFLYLSARETTFGYSIPWSPHVSHFSSKTINWVSSPSKHVVLLTLTVAINRSMGWFHEVGSQLPHSVCQQQNLSNKSENLQYFFFVGFVRFVFVLRRKLHFPFHFLLQNLSCHDD